jgi:hypothetical protein
MSVADLSRLHAQYVRLSDKFKAFWTYNQFAAGVYKNILQAALPYQIQFQEIYDAIRSASDVIQSISASDAAPLMTRIDHDLQRASAHLLRADAEITPSVLRRFFEKLRRLQDEKIVFNLVKFYLYAEAYDGEQRDKIDFLFTKIGEDYIEERNEYVLRDSLELRRQIQGLLTARPPLAADSGEIASIVKSVRRLREEVEAATKFEQLTEGNLLQRGRQIKHTIGDSFVHPEVLLHIIDLNIVTKNRFSALYREEEARILENSQRVLANEESITRGFRLTNPSLLEEFARFKVVKEEFDESRASSNVKHDVVTRLKASIHTILSELDRDLVPEPPSGTVSEAFMAEAQRSEAIESRVGEDPVVNPYVGRITSILDYFGGSAAPETVARSAQTRALRLEPWEVAAYQKLFCARPLGEHETAAMMRLFLRAAALRLKVEEEAGQLVSDGAAGAALLRRVKQTLESARQFDSEFKDHLQEAMCVSDARLARYVYRSRLRLLRSFSGLWLLYDQQTAHD